MTRSNGPYSITTFSSDDNKNLECLLDVFGSKISIEDMASAYCEAGRNLERTTEMLVTILGSSSSNKVPNLTDAPTSSTASLFSSVNTPVGISFEPMNLSQRKPTNCGAWVGTGYGINGVNYATSGTLTDEPPKVLSRAKPRKSGISVGTVSGVIGADYGRLRSSTKEAREITKPNKLMPSEFPASLIWDEKPVNTTNETMNEDVELFLLKMLGDGFQLDMEVIRNVVGGCGYDVQKSMETLMNMSAPTLDLGDTTSSIVDKTKSKEAYQDLDIQFEEKLQFSNAAQSNNSNLEKEILCTLFAAPERSQVRPILPKRQPRTRKYGVVTAPLEDKVAKFSTPIVQKEVNGNGNEEIEDNYDNLREAVMNNWTTMKNYYRAAADQYAKGNYEHADVFVKKGHFFMDKAREANEKSSKMLTETRNDGEVISVDLNTYDPKESIHLLKTQLKNFSSIPSIRYLKANVGTNDGKAKPNARKRLITRLLERDEIPWTEEQEGRIMVIRIDTINPKRLSFNKT